MVKYTIDVPEPVWQSYKATIGQHRTINDHIVELIEDEINE